MTDMTTELGAQFARQKVALLWVICGLGNTVYAAIQILTFANREIDGSGPASAAFDAVVLWYFGVACSIWIIPALLPLVTRGRAGVLTSSVLGGLLAVTSVAGGVLDGMHDGFHIAATAIIAVALPGICAIRVSWRHLRGGGAPVHPVKETASGPALQRPATPV